jgi:hypothetical protein
MPMLVVGGVTVPVAREGGVDHDVEEFGGDRTRAFDGTMRSTVRARKGQWSIVTTLMAGGAKDTLVAALVATPPVTCSGDILGASTSCHIVLQKVAPESVRGALKYRVHFMLYEA